MDKCYKCKMCKTKEALHIEKVSDTTYRFCDFCDDCLKILKSKEIIVSDLESIHKSIKKHVKDFISLTENDDGSKVCDLKKNFEEEAEKILEVAALVDGIKLHIKNSL